MAHEIVITTMVNERARLNYLPGMDEVVIQYLGMTHFTTPKRIKPVPEKHRIEFLSDNGRVACVMTGIAETEAKRLQDWIADVREVLTA